MFRSLAFAIAFAFTFASSAYALEPSEVFGTWQDASMRVEISDDSVVMGFQAPNYDQGVERAPVTFQEYQEGLLLRVPDGSGVLITLLPDGRLSWVFPGVAATTLERVTER